MVVMMRGCPKCGGKPVQKKAVTMSGEGYYFVCRECKYSSATRPSLEEAIMAWNGMDHSVKVELRDGPMIDGEPTVVIKLREFMTILDVIAMCSDGVSGGSGMGSYMNDTPGSEFLD